MGFRFRKSASFGPLRINFSKSGVGYSVGGKGFRVTKKATGGYRATASVPGTGFSYVKETGGKAKRASEHAEPGVSGGYPGKPPKKDRSPMTYKICGVACIVIAFALLLFTVVSLVVAPILGIVIGLIDLFLLLYGFFCIDLAAEKQGRTKSVRWKIVTAVIFVCWGLLFYAAGTSSAEEKTPSESIASSVIDATPQPTVEPALQPTVEPTAELTSEPTTEPTPEPTPEPTAEPTAEPAAEPSEQMVWIASTGDGTKYHRKASCSRMNNPIELPISEAQARGYEPCGICYR